MNVLCNYLQKLCPVAIKLQTKPNQSQIWKFLCEWNKKHKTMQNRNSDCCNTETYPLTAFVLKKKGIYFETSHRKWGSSFWLARLRPSMVCFRPDENIKVCGVLVSCQTAEVSQSVSAVQRGRSDRSRVSLSTEVTNHSAPLEVAGPRHVEPLSPWLTYTPPPRSCVRRFTTPAGQEEHRGAY